MTKIVVEFDNEQQVQRLLYLANRDLCRSVGAEVMAKEKLDSQQETGQRLPGRIRKNAVQTIETAPQQQEVLEGAMDALKLGLKTVKTPSPEKSHAVSNTD